MKKFISLSLAAMLSASAMGITALAEDKITVTVNGAEVAFEDQAPFIENERTLVPMRAIFEALGAVVEWDGETQTVISYDPKSEVSIVLQIGSNKLFVNDKPVELDVAAKVVNERTMVPVRAIAEGMNCEVDWDQEKLTVIIIKNVEPGFPIEETEKPTTEPETQGTEIANPWTEYKTLDELNAAISNNADAKVKYAVADPSVPATVSENGYRYLAAENMAEIKGLWEVGGGADIVIRTMPGDTDISGITGGEKLSEEKIGDSMVEFYRYAENTVYAVWTCDDAGTLYSHSVSVTSPDFDTIEVCKTLVKDVEDHHPKG